MIESRSPRQDTLFVVGSLRDLIPGDHILRRVDRVLDLSWLRDEVRDLYDECFGRPGIDPEAAVRLMLAGFFHNLVHDRRLMREAQVNLAIRWFAGYEIQERLPDHSSLTRIRQRWGADRFRRIFARTVEQCAAAGLVSGETVHVDATLIRADVSWESLTTEHADRVWSSNDGDADEAKEEGVDPPKKGVRPRTKPAPKKKRSRTDPDATMATSRKDQRLEPSYKQHTAVDDAAGVVVDVSLTTGEASEGKQLIEVIGNVEERLGAPIKTVTADGGYAHPANFKALEDRDLEALIPPQKVSTRRGRIPLRRFKYDAKNRVLYCPGKKILPQSTRAKNGWIHRARTKDCRDCPLRARCVPKTATARSVLIVDCYESLLRARRYRARWGPRELEHYARHRWRVEGAHGEAKTRHGLRRAVRRGLDNVAIQVYLTAAVMNLKRLAKALWRRFWCLITSLRMRKGPRAAFWDNSPGMVPRSNVLLQHHVGQSFA